MFHHGRAPLQHLRGVEDAPGLRGVVGGVSSDRRASCVHLVDGPIVLWQRETSHCVSVGIHRGTFWNGHVVLRQDGHAHTEHHDYRGEASVVRDFRARVVVVCMAVDDRKLSSCLAFQPRGLGRRTWVSQSRGQFRRVRHGVAPEPSRPSFFGSADNDIAGTGQHTRIWWKCLCPFSEGML